MTKKTKFEKIYRIIAYIIAWVNIIMGWLIGLFGFHSKGIFTMFVGVVFILTLNNSLRLN